MKANILLNVEVVSKNNGKSHGLVKKIIVENNIVKYLMISCGGIFVKSQFFRPENIVEVSYKSMVIDHENSIEKIKAKELNKSFENYFSLIDHTVVDKNGEMFGRIVNATVNSGKFNITEYEISRSFFDDIDHGFGVALPTELNYKDSVLQYQNNMFDLKLRSHDTGIAKKILGV
jgi:uncharacterized protein YrrD